MSNTIWLKNSKGVDRGQRHNLRTIDHPQATLHMVEQGWKTLVETRTNTRNRSQTITRSIQIVCRTKQKIKELIELLTQFGSGRSRSRVTNNPCLTVNDNSLTRPTSSSKWIPLILKRAFKLKLQLEEISNELRWVTNHCWIGTPHPLIEALGIMEVVKKTEKSARVTTICLYRYMVSSQAGSETCH